MTGVMDMNGGAMKSKISIVIIFMLICLVASGYLMVSCARDLATATSDSVTYSQGG